MGRKYTQGQGIALEGGCGATAFTSSVKHREFVFWWWWWWLQPLEQRMPLLSITNTTKNSLPNDSIDFRPRSHGRREEQWCCWLFRQWAGWLYQSTFFLIYRKQRWDTPPKCPQMPWCKWQWGRTASHKWWVAHASRSVGEGRAHSAWNWAFAHWLQSRLWNGAQSHMFSMSDSNKNATNKKMIFSSPPALAAIVSLHTHKIAPSLVLIAVPGVSLLGLHGSRSMRIANNKRLLCFV